MKLTLQVVLIFRPIFEYDSLPVYQLQVCQLLWPIGLPYVKLYKYFPCMIVLMANKSDDDNGKLNCENCKETIRSILQQFSAIFLVGHSSQSINGGERPYSIPLILQNMISNTESQTDRFYQNICGLYSLTVSCSYEALTRSLFNKRRLNLNCGLSSSTITRWHRLALGVSHVTSITDLRTYMH